MKLWTAALVLAAMGCAGQQLQPRAFVESVYRAHDPSRPGDSPWDEARCRTTFSARLCDLLDKDRREAGDEVPRLDGDPLYAAQDFAVADLAFTVEGNAADHAGVAVTFTNFGRKQSLLVSVVRDHGGWRIDEIIYRHEQPPQTLTDILTAPR